MNLLKEFRKTLGASYNGYSEGDIRKIHQAYYPIGFIAYQLGNMDKKLNSYDLNSAYPSVIRDYLFPFDAEFKEENFIEEQCSYDEYVSKYKDINIAWVSFSSYKKRYQKVKYDIFFTQIDDKFDNSMYYFFDKINVKGEERFKGVVTSIDLENLRMLYKVKDLKVHYVLKFDDIRRVNEETKKFIEDLYEKKNQYDKESEEYKEVKEFLNKYIYGKQVARNWQKFKAYGKKCYTNYTVFGLWIPAYVRNIMIKKFVEDIENVAYIDTDCIKTKSKMNSSDRLGDFKCEYEDVDIYFCRLKVYFVYKNGELIKQVTSGFQGISEDDIEKLRNGEVVTTKVKDKNGNIIDYSFYDMIHYPELKYEAALQVMSRKSAFKVYDMKHKSKLEKEKDELWERVIK